MFAIIAGFPENLFVCFGVFSSPPGPWVGKNGLRVNQEIIMKRTYQASKVRRARTHGFLVRMKTRGGRAVINARRAKGRKRLAV
jgi:large subunit ribosomal protein L34